MADFTEAEFVNPWVILPARLAIVYPLQVRDARVARPTRNGNAVAPWSWTRAAPRP